MNKDVDETFEFISDYAEKENIPIEAAVDDLVSKSIISGAKGLKPVMPLQEKTDNFLFNFGIPVPTPIGVQQLKIGQPAVSDFEIDERGLLVGKDRPKNLARGLAGMADIFTGQLFDFDKRGGNPLFGLTGDNVSLQGYGKEFEGDYELPTSAKEKIKDLYKSEEETSATSPTTEAVQAFIDQYPELKKIQKDQMLTQSLFGAGQYVATEPIRQAFLNKAAEDNLRRQQRGRVFEELTPSEISKRASEDQARRLAGSQGFAIELQSMADAQRAAAEAASKGIRAPAATFSV